MCGCTDIFFTIDWNYISILIITVILWYVYSILYYTYYIILYLVYHIIHRVLDETLIIGRRIC